MMRRGVPVGKRLDKLSVSPAALLIVSLLVYFLDGKTLLLLALPAAVHEAGHLLALRLFGLPVRAVRAEPGGLCIEYAARCGKWEQAAVALSGPLFGVLYALAARGFGDGGRISAGVSLLLTWFNLIPAQPLDGAQITAALMSGKAASALAVFSAAATAACGLWLFAAGKGLSLAAAGLLLLLRQLRPA